MILYIKFNAELVKFLIINNVLIYQFDVLLQSFLLLCYYILYLKEFSPVYINK